MVPGLIAFLGQWDNAPCPDRVFKGKKLPGRMGGVRVTAPQGGSGRGSRADREPDSSQRPIPGSKGRIVFIRKS